MKTLTELSGSLVRTAAAAVAEARRSLPRDEAPVTPAVVVAPPATDEAVPAAPDAPSEAADEAAPPVAPEQPAEGAEPAAAASPAPAAKLDPDAESETVKAILDDAVAKATGCSGDRLVMLRAAVKAVGRRAGDVRLVRVFGVEEQLRGAQVIGERQYIVDFLPSNMKQVADAHRSEKGRGKGGGGRGGGGGGGDRGAKGASTGGFSMDSLKDDRKNERGGRSGGGPRKPGGPGRPAGGPPKK
ncbi:MAG: translation initiation factor 2 [Anaeromyxobacteraceae bacterium]|nr:translation initiation factor 2 [Anaeromyxobacteraceae bacterium]